MNRISRFLSFLLIFAVALNAPMSADSSETASGTENIDEAGYLPPAWRDRALYYESFDQKSEATAEGAFLGRSGKEAWKVRDEAVSPHQSRTYSFWWALAAEHPIDGSINWLRIRGAAKGWLVFMSRGKGKWAALKRPAAVAQVWYLDGVPGASAVDKGFLNHFDLEPGVWHHTAVTVYSGRTVSVYLNGEIWRKLTVKEPGIEARHALHELTIGPVFSGQTPLLVDEIVVLDLALGEQAIFDYYRAMRAIADHE